MMNCYSLAILQPECVPAEEWGPLNEYLEKHPYLNKLLLRFFRIDILFAEDGVRFFVTVAGSSEPAVLRAGLVYFLFC